MCDYGDVIVHLFSEHLRGYYDLESLWSDAPRLDWRSMTTPGQFSNLSVSSASV